MVGTKPCLATLEPLNYHAVASNLFWKYAHFLNFVAGAVDMGSSYCEGCECHEHEGLKHNSYQVRRKRLRSATNHEGNGNEMLPYPPSCPLKNRRSADIASGAFNTFIRDTLQVTKDSLNEFRGSLADSEWQIILDDWMSARVSCMNTNICFLIHLSSSIFASFVLTFGVYDAFNTTW